MSAAGRQFEPFVIRLPAAHRSLRKSASVSPASLMIPAIVNELMGAIGHDDVFALADDLESSALQGADCPLVSDTGDPAHV